jgi:hypothetical protein
MPSVEGRGKARAAWDKYLQVSSKVFGPTVETLFGSAIKSVSASTVSDLVGFWILWHLHGGFEGVQQLGMSRSSVFRKVAMFRRVFGSHPDEYVFPGIHLDVEEYFGGKVTPERS